VLTRRLTHVAGTEPRACGRAQHERLSRDQQRKMRQVEQVMMRCRLDLMYKFSFGDPVREGPKWRPVFCFTRPRHEQNDFMGCDTWHSCTRRSPKYLFRWKMSDSFGFLCCGGRVTRRWAPAVCAVWHVTRHVGRLHFQCLNSVSAQEAIICTYWLDKRLAAVLIDLFRLTSAH
jgi:hypothetical protein